MSAAADPLDRNAPLRRLAVAAVLVAVAFLACFRVTNLDIGGHLTVGREILKTGAIPDTEFFSHTAKGHPYPVHQWLGEVGLFGIDHLFGTTGLVLARMAAVLLGAVLLYRSARREGAPVVVACAIVLVLAVAARPRFFVRPFLATWVFLPLLHSLVADVREGRTRRLWPVPVLLGVWGHVHSGVLFGILYLLGVLAGEAGKLLLARRGAARVPGGHVFPGAPLDGWNFRRLAIFSAAAIAAPFATLALVNPSGVKPLLLPLLFFRHDAFRAMIAEYRPVDLARDWPFDVVAGVLLLGLLFRGRRADLGQLIVVLGFGFLAFRAVRGILPFAAVAAPTLARTWGALAEDLFARALRGGGRRAARMTRANAGEATAILLVVLAAGAVSVRAAQGWLFPFGFGKDPKHYPERALDFLWSQNVRGQIFNTDVFASSLLWRGKGRRFPVFVDARLEAYPESFWRDSYYRVLRAAPGWEDVLARHDVQCAMVRREGGKSDDAIGEALWASPDWGLAYWNDHAMIFARREGPSDRNREVLAEWEFDAFAPRRPQSVLALDRAGLERAAMQLERLVAWESDSFLPRWTLAAAWTRLGRGTEAAGLLAALSGRREARGNAAFARSRAEAELVAGRRGEWERHLRAAGGDPADPGELFGAAALLSRTGQESAAAGLYREVLAARPEHADAMNNLALLLARSGATDEARELAERALTVAPRDAYYVATLGEVLAQAGDRAAALATFRRALELLPAGDAAAREEVMRWILRLEE